MFISLYTKSDEYKVYITVHNFVVDSIFTYIILKPNIHLIYLILKLNQYHSEFLTYSHLTLTSMWLIVT